MDDPKSNKAAENQVGASQWDSVQGLNQMIDDWRRHTQEVLSAMVEGGLSNEACGALVDCAAPPSPSDLPGNWMKDAFEAQFGGASLKELLDRGLIQIGGPPDRLSVAAIQLWPENAAAHLRFLATVGSGSGDVYREGTLLTMEGWRLWETWHRAAEWLRSRAEALDDCTMPAKGGQHV